MLFIRYDKINSYIYHGIVYLVLSSLYLLVHYFEHFFDLISNLFLGMMSDRYTEIPWHTIFFQVQMRFFYQFLRHYIFALDNLNYQRNCNNTFIKNVEISII